jgi:NAD(P)-dependent dehydrogenase (short-subunit alcohol dehydrogenase family)
MPKIMIIGATGLIGRHLVSALSNHAELITASRKGGMETVDIRDVTSIDALFSRIEPVDHIISVAGEAPFKPFDMASNEDWQNGIASKMMGQINLVRKGWHKIVPGGSITLTSGVLSSYPMPGSSVISTINAAVEGFTRAAAVELSGKVRVNAISPGWISETLQAMGMNTEPGLPAAQVAEAYRALLTSDATGQIKITMKQ